jgi:predicted dehydrogenase
MAKQITCGIIGCGVIAPLHAECLGRVPDARLKYACDLVEDRARALASSHGIERTTTDYREILADPEVDAVHVCTDHASHAAICIAALRAGKHVLCEKPLGAHPADLDAMVRTHRETPDLVFAGVFQHRFEPINRYLKHLVDEALFGTLLHASISVRCLRTDDYYRSASWRGTWREEGGGVLINQAIHFVDVIGWIAGGVSAVCGDFANRSHLESIEVEDTAVAAVRFTNGALGSIEATSSTRHIDWEHTLTLIGTEGSIVVFCNEPRHVAFLDRDRKERVEHELSRLKDAVEPAPGKQYYGPGHPAQIADFIEAVRDRNQPFVPAESARAAVDLVLGVYRSAKEGRWVTLPDRDSR